MCPDQTGDDDGSDPNYANCAVSTDDGYSGYCLYWSDDGSPAGSTLLLGDGSGDADADETRDAVYGDDDVSSDTLDSLTLADRDSYRPTTAHPGQTGLARLPQVLPSDPLSSLDPRNSSSRSEDSYLSVLALPLTRRPARPRCPRASLAVAVSWPFSCDHEKLNLRLHIHRVRPSLKEGLSVKVDRRLGPLEPHHTARTSRKMELEEYGNGNRFKLSCNKLETKVCWDS